MLVRMVLKPLVTLILLQGSSPYRLGQPRFGRMQIGWLDQALLDL